MTKLFATFNSIGKAHLAKAFHWTGDTGTETAEALAAGFGKPASAGSLAVGRVEIGPDFRSHLKRVAGELAPAIVASSLAIFFRGTGWLPAAALVLLSAIAATISAFSV